MHARPAAEFVRCARRFKSTIEILVRGKSFSAQRLLEVLLAGLHAGSRFQLVAEGPDAKSALDTLGALLKQQAETEKVRAAESDGFRWR
jgi:phosphotransferase system HPr (HPr) family protein